VIQMLLGLLRPTLGRARIAGDDSRNLTPAARGAIGYMPESHPVHRWMTVQQEATFAAAFHRRWNWQLFESVLRPFDISPTTPAKKLLPAQRAAVALAITVAPEPELLILDEPPVGLDPRLRPAILAAVHSAQKSGRTVLLSSRGLDDLERVADHVAMLDRGALVAAGSPDDLVSAVRQFRITFAPRRAPIVLPPIRGMVSSQRVDDVVLLTVLKSGEDTRAAIGALSPISVQEAELSFAEATACYVNRDEGPRFSPTPATNAVAGGG
jgi:ABC-2 type transport system ATP-binding protein